MLFSVNFLLVAIAAKGCIDNMLWRDTFGWSCRDYSRDPLECSSNYAVSVGGIEAQEACCACVIPVERRRDYAECIDICSADENACESECFADKAECQFECQQEYEEEEEDEDDTGGLANGDDNGDESSTGTVGGIRLDEWVIVLIVLGVLLCLCIVIIVLYFLCLPRDEGTCEDDVATQQPMLVGGGCDAPPCETGCDTPCDAPTNYPVQQMAYSQVPAGYPQGQRW